jgi:hypothetical protein
MFSFGFQWIICNYTKKEKWMKDDLLPQVSLGEHQCPNPNPEIK